MYMCGVPNVNKLPVSVSLTKQPDSLAVCVRVYVVGRSESRSACLVIFCTAHRGRRRAARRCSLMVCGKRNCQVANRPVAAARVCSMFSIIVRMRFYAVHEG